MSQCICKGCKGIHSHLILSYFNTISSENSDQQKWIPIKLLCDHMHLRFTVEDDMKFTKTMSTRTIFKNNAKTGREANKVVVLAENLLVAWCIYITSRFNVEIIINWHRHYKASASLCTNILSAVSYLVFRLIFIVCPEDYYDIMPKYYDYNIGSEW